MPTLSPAPQLPSSPGLSPPSSPLQSPVLCHRPTSAAYPSMCVFENGHLHPKSIQCLNAKPSAYCSYLSPENSARESDGSSGLGRRGAALRTGAHLGPLGCAQNGRQELGKGQVPEKGDEGGTHVTCLHLCETSWARAACGLLSNWKWFRATHKRIEIWGNNLSRNQGESIALSFSVHTCPHRKPQAG